MQEGFAAAGWRPRAASSMPVMVGNVAKSRPYMRQYVQGVHWESSMVGSGYWAEKDIKTDFTPCTLRRASLLLCLPYTIELRILTRNRAASIFAPCLFSLSFDAFLCGGSSLATTITVTSTSSLYPTNYFAVTVIVVALGRVVLSLSQPPPGLSAHLLILLISHRIHEPQSNCLRPPGCTVVLVRSAISEGHHSKDTQMTASTEEVMRYL